MAFRELSVTSVGELVDDTPTHRRASAYEVVDGTIDGAINIPLDQS